jgi:hypothetical protein
VGRNSRGIASSILVSLSLIQALHHKLTLLLEKLQPEQLVMEFIHPETQKRVAIHNMIALYAWHGAHHTAHITELRKKHELVINYARL